MCKIPCSTKQFDAFSLNHNLSIICFSYYHENNTAKHTLLKSRDLQTPNILQITDLTQDFEASGNIVLKVLIIS